MFETKSNNNYDQERFTNIEYRLNEIELRLRLLAEELEYALTEIKRLKTSEVTQTPQKPLILEDN